MSTGNIINIVKFTDRVFKEKTDLKREIDKEYYRKQ